MLKIGKNWGKIANHSPQCSTKIGTGTPECMDVQTFRRVGCNGLNKWRNGNIVEVLGEDEKKSSLDFEVFSGSLLFLNITSK